MKEIIEKSAVHLSFFSNVMKIKPLKPFFKRSNQVLDMIKAFLHAYLGYQTTVNARAIYKLSHWFGRPLGLNAFISV